jgi:uncharacterized delta-60 repeat protein
MGERARGSRHAHHPVLVLLLVLGAAILSVVTTATAAPRAGTLDRTFGDHGKVLPELPGTFLGTEFTAMARQPDGGLILGANRQNRRGETEGAIERRGPRGNLDPSFGRGGIVAADSAHGLLVGGDGGILFATLTGNSCRAGSELRRLTPGGGPDPHFGVGGTTAEVPIDVEELAFAPDGGILLAGHGLEGPCGHDLTPHGELALARLRPDGSLDPTFGRGGIVLAGRDLGRSDTAPVAVAIEPGGRILLAARDSLYAFTPAGSLDQTFGAGGIITPAGAIGAILAAPGGGVFVASSSTASCCEEPGDYVLARYGTDGALAPDFGSAGVSRVDFGVVDEPTALALTPDGGVVLAGRSTNFPRLAGARWFVPVLARFLPTGALDPSFGEGGRTGVSAPVGPARAPTQSSEIAALSVASDGRVLAAGGSGPGGDAFIVGLDAGGSADPDFGRIGSVQEILKTPSSAEAAGLAIEPNGHILVTASSNTGVRSARPILFNFDRRGRPDREVGGRGFIPTSAEGPIVAAGPDELFALGSDEQHGYVTRFGNRGRLDRAYGKEGHAALPTRFNPRSLLARPDGSVLVLGSVRGRKLGMAAYRLGPRGRPDPTFGHRGLAVVAFGDRVNAEARGALVGPGGRIVLFGSQRATAAVARLLPSGRLDRGFGHRGRLTDFLGHGTRALLAAPAPGGGIVLACLREPASGSGGTRLVRLGPDGALASGFGGGGIVQAPGTAPPLALFSGPRRIVLLTARPGRSTGGVLLRGFAPDGRIDRHYGVRGSVTAAVGQRRPFVPVAAARDPRGRIVVAGTAGAEEFERGIELLRFR